VVPRSEFWEALRERADQQLYIHYAGVAFFHQALSREEADRFCSAVEDVGSLFRDGDVTNEVLYLGRANLFFQARGLMRGQHGWIESFLNKCTQMYVRHAEQVKAAIVEFLCIFEFHREIFPFSKDVAKLIAEKIWKTRLRWEYCLSDAKYREIYKAMETEEQMGFSF
jgi:hypothetical protein